LESALPRLCSGRAELVPLGECGDATVLENLSADERAFLIAMVVNGAVQGGEFLKASHLPEAEHGPFTSSEYLVRTLGAIVPPAAELAPCYPADPPKRCSI
jgi:hypothetical protein